MKTLEVQKKSKNYRPSFQHFGHNLDTNKITTLNP